MNRATEVILKTLRKLHDKFPISGFRLHRFIGEEQPQCSSDIILSYLQSPKPCMIARFGSTELNAISNYLAVNAEQHSAWQMITRRQPQWWWNKKSIDQLTTNAGFFPNTVENVADFCKLMLTDSADIDILCRWIKEEYYINNYLPKDVKSIFLLTLEPWWAERPWTACLEGKRVLVVHPFAKLIEKQYAEKRQLLFKSKAVLPEFHLETLQAVQSLGGESNGFNSWFEALQWMEHEIDSRDYDICLIGCGAYGLPLAAHCKRMGKKAIHMGGALQLLFGIRGKRWDNSLYGDGVYFYKDLFNEHWVYPTDEYKPSSANKVEGGCYW